MTIFLYSGTPGSGKSLHATKEIKIRLDYRHPVIANYRLSPSIKHFDLFTYVNNQDMTPDLLYDYAIRFWGKRHVKEDYLLLVIDEAQLLFNSREWNANQRMAWLEFFSQHRKYGFRIIMIAQFDRMIDRQIRSLFEYNSIHRRLGNMGIRGKLFTFLVLGELFVVTTKFYSMNETVSVKAFRVHKSVYRMYDSYAAFARTEDGVSR